MKPDLATRRHFSAGPTEKELQRETRASLVAILIGSNSSLSYKRASPSTQIPAARAYRARTRQRVFTRVTRTGLSRCRDSSLSFFRLCLVSFCLAGEAYTTKRCPTDLHPNGNTITYKFIQLRRPAASLGRGATYIACAIVLDTLLRPLIWNESDLRKTVAPSLIRSSMREKCTNFIIACQRWIFCKSIDLCEIPGL